MYDNVDIVPYEILNGSIRFQDMDAMELHGILMENAFLLMENPHPSGKNASSQPNLVITPYPYFNYNRKILSYFGKIC